MKQTPKNAAILVRISDDRDKDAAGVGRQEQDARALAERLGWTITDVFCENDTSAFKRRVVTLPDGSEGLRVLRPEFRRLLEGITLGQVDGFIAYDLDRVARDPRDLEDLIDAVEAKQLPVESVSGSLRLANDSDVTMARVMVAVANKSSRDSSRRIKRKHEELAQAGEFAGGGARRYGYAKDGVTICEPEADAIREGVARVLAGETVGLIGRDFDARGIKPVKAARWSAKSLTDILRSPRVAGLRVHRGEVVGPAMWPAIIDRETHDAVVAALHARGGAKIQPTLVRWCNGLLFCGRCGHVLSASKSNVPGKHRYWCNSYRDGGCGKIAISAHGVEDEIARQVVEYLERPDVIARLAEVAGTTGAARARTDLAADEAQLKELAGLWAEKKIGLTEWAEARKVIEERIEDARKLALAHVSPKVRKLLGSPNPAAGWEGLDPATRREVVRALLSIDGYVGWKVAPADVSQARRFDPARLSLATS